ncbi:unnamed protein product [Protopolystoma xenopodis]|uniref:Uncharacterized protein n=1 Tax=Protopolystoma xenopodis TaxID=117903 RepID=A0A3S5B8H9_9PLAT|nr:unnamed protein product [Protopolystoma xenopodis]
MAIQPAWAGLLGQLTGPLSRDAESECSRHGVELAFTRLWRLLVFEAGRADQLEALAAVGLCLDTAWVTHSGQPPRLHLCVGQNLVGRSLVDEWLPQPEMGMGIGIGIRNATPTIGQLCAQVDRLLGQLPRRPDLVTLVRSVRDGYTPHDRQPDIEAAILDVLERRLGLGPTDTVYSKHLLGGVRGWARRPGRALRPSPVF